MPHAVFLDRDDTLIANSSLPAPDPTPPNWVRGDLADPNRVQLLPGALQACTSLVDAGFLLIVVTNQAVVARGGATLDDVLSTNERVRSLLVYPQTGRPLLHAIYYCPYHPDGSVPGFAQDHPWRKPAPGMILAAAKDHNVDLAQSWLIGDARRDIESAIAAGIQESRSLLIGPDGNLPDLAAAAALVLARSAQ